MADLAIDFYGTTPSYTENYLRLNSRNFDPIQVSNPLIYNTGIINDRDYYVGLTGGDGPTYSSVDYLLTDIEYNTQITETSTGFNSGPNGSIDTKYFINIGKENTLIGDNTSLVVGNNNETGIRTENVIILGGSNNKIENGITQSVIINGENIISNRSNQLILGSDTLSSKPIQNVIHIIESKVSEYNLHSIFNVVDSGVRPIYIKSTTNVIEPDISVYFRK